MYRHEPEARGLAGQCRPIIKIVLAALVAFCSGCVPPDEGTTTDFVTSATEAAISQFFGFITDFARQLLAAYLF